MKQKLLNSFRLKATLLVAVLCALFTGQAWAADTYEQLTSIANIDESAEYVLGIDGTGFHYEGTSSWGKTALPSAQTPIKYTLKKANDGNSFTAEATISGTKYYLQIPTSNTFSMATTTGTNTDIIIGTTQVSGTNYAVANKTTTTRHLRINGSSGLRSYAGTTGTMAFFYKVVPDVPSYTITAQSNNTSYGTVSLSGSVITATPATGYTYASPAYSVSPANSAAVTQNGNEFTVTPSANTTVTINFEALPTYTVTLSDDTENPLTEASAGAGVTLPSRSAIGSYTFAGWCTTNVPTETTTAPTSIIPEGTYNPTANITLYPVYSKTEGGGGSVNKTASVTISGYASDNSWSNSTKYETVTLDANVTATANGNSNTGKYYTSGGGSWRFYSSESGYMTISVSNGELTSATITFSNATLSYNEENITSGSPVSLSGTSASFYAGGTTYITAISVNYTTTGGGTTYYWSSPVAAAVERPEITIAENPFLFSTTATITCETEGAAIKYSYDNENWNDYSSELTITETKTIYAKAVKNEVESTVASVTATKNLATPTVTVSGDLTLDLDGETNVSAGTLTAAVTYNESAVGGATVTWESSAPAVATIDANGAVTLLTTGEVTFTATYAGNGDYASDTGTKTVTVVDSNVPGSSAENPYSVAQAIENTPSSGTSANVYIRGIVSSFHSTDIISDGANYRYYISDDGTTTDQLLVYKGKKNSTTNFTNVSDLEIGDVVIIYGGLTTYNSTKEVASGNYIVSLTRKVAATITVTNGTEQNVDRTQNEDELTLSATANSGATVVFTIDNANTTLTEDTDFEFENGQITFLTAKGGVIVVKANAAAAGDYLAATEVTITITVIGEKKNPTIVVNDSKTVAYGSTFTVDDSMIEGGAITVTSGNTAVATVEGLVITPVAVGTTTITVATAENTEYKAGSETFTLTVTTPAGQSAAYVSTPTTVFEETFANSTGTNSDFGTSSTGDGNGTFTADSGNEWVVANAYGANGAAKFGAAKKKGSATTPSFTTTVGTTYTLTFKAAPWASESTTMTVTITGGTIDDENSVETSIMNTGEWNEFSYDIVASSTSMTISFSGSNNRFFLDEVKVTKPAETSTTVTTTGGYATYCYQYPLNLGGISGAKAYIVEGINTEKEKLTLTQITGTIKGGVPFVLKADGADDTFEIPFAEEESTTVPADNHLVGTLAPTFVAQMNGDYTNFAYSKSYECFVKLGDSGNTVPANRAYLPINLGSGSPVKAFTFEFSDADGIQSINNEQLTIDNSAIFNLAGQRLNKLQKGINIVNGKKVLVK